MKVLALAINYKGFTVETLYHEQCALKYKVESCGGQFFLFGPGYDYPTNDVSIYVDLLSSAGERPDVIISYLSECLFFQPLPEEICCRYLLDDNFRYFPRGVEKISDIPKVMWINDFWHMTSEQWDWTLLGHGFNHVIATYSPPFLRESDFMATYSSRLRGHVQFYPLSRGINSQIFKDYGEPRSIDVTLLGARGEFYPLREYFHQSLANQTWFSYFSNPHPGYIFDQSTTLSGHSYAKVLSRSRIFVSCTGRYSLPFIKIFEVLASGALLMCDRPCGASFLGLVDGETYVEVDRVNFLEKVRHYLWDEKERERISCAGRKLFQEQHTTEKNSGRIFDIIAGIVEKQKSDILNIGAGMAGGCYDVDPVCMPIVGEAAKRGPLLITNFLGKLIDSWRHKSVPKTVFMPWEEIKGGTCLDWSRVVEVCHALQISQLSSVREVSLVEKFGLNAHWSERPVLTQYPEAIAVRAKILKLLAAALGARVFCEVGTARGLQSIFWADYLREEKVEDAIVATCDIVGHDTPIYRMPLSDGTIWTRRELWEQECATAQIDFVHGDSSVLGAMLGERLREARIVDLLYIDGSHDEAGAYSDYFNLKLYLGNDSVIIFDDCDPRFPGVERAVNRVAAEMNTEVRLINFWPSPYTVAVLNSKLSLSSVGDPSAGR